MKHFLKISVVLFLCAFASCDKGDDNDDGDQMTNEELIVGTWSIDSRSVNGVADTFDECEALFAVTFTSDLNFTSFERSGENCDTTTQTSGSYTLNGDTLVVSQGAMSITGEIISLTSSNLSIRFTEDETVIENYSR